jgi:hypothetical protein
VIRQAISCDICATEKKQTNHWFVAYEQGGELRVGGWSSRNRLRPGSKHLCGQTCLHKLVDEFMAKAISMKTQKAGVEEAAETPAVTDTRPTDTSLTSNAAYTAVESSHRVEMPSPANAVSRPQAELVTMPGRPQPEPLDEPPAYSSRSWHAEAWERERERELNAAERRPDILARRRSRA